MARTQGMKYPQLVAAFVGLWVAMGAWMPAAAQVTDAGPYHVLRSDRVGGEGGWDYVYADPVNRRLYVPRSDRVTVFDLDTFAPVGTIPDTHAVHGVAIDPATQHAFCSSNPVVMWDARTLTVLKTINVAGSPDGILFEPSTERIYVLSHRAPNVTVIDAKEGSVVGTIDLGGAPEQAASNGSGRVYIDLENRDKVAVVDADSLKVVGTYGLKGKGGGPGGLALDTANHILFVCCHEPNTAVIMNADDGSILDTLPIGLGVDSAEFNPQTGEAFSSQRDGTLTVIKEAAPDSFSVEQTVRTEDGARTSTLDPKTGHILLVTAKFERPKGPASDSGAAPAPARHRLPVVPGSFTILEVGR